MATSIDILKQRARKLNEEFERLVPNCTAPNISRRLDQLQVEYDTVCREIEQVNTSNRFAASYLSLKESAEIRRFSFSKFVKEAVNHTLTGFEAEMHEEGVREFIAISGNAPKGFVIPQRVLQGSNSINSLNIGTQIDHTRISEKLGNSFFDQLAIALGLPALGASFITDFKGSEPTYLGGEFSSYWLAKDDSRTKVYNAVFGDVFMRPNPLIATSIFKNRVIKQMTPAAEAWILNGLITANAQALLQAAIYGLLANSQIVGILNNPGTESIVGGVNGSVPTWENIVHMEEKVSLNSFDAGVIGYLTNPSVRATLKQTLKSLASNSYIWEGSAFLNGLRTVISNAVPSNLTKGTSEGICSAIIAGDWSKLFIGMWGGLDVLVDPFTLVDSEQTRIITNSFTDVAITNPKSFCVMKDALTI